MKNLDKYETQEETMILIIRVAFVFMTYIIILQRETRVSSTKRS